MSKIGIDVSEKLCGKPRYFYFNNERKEDIFFVICQNQNIIQEKYKMNVHIVASWIQLIYILWVFYVRMLSICHKFIDSSIYGGSIPHIFLNCLQGNNLKRVVPKGTKYHWVNPYLFILSIWKAIISIESSEGTSKYHWVNPYPFFSGCKAIISRESAQWTLRPIGIVPINLFYLSGRQ